MDEPGDSVDDRLDGCDLSELDDLTLDENIPWIVLFADVNTHDRRAVRRRRREWQELFGGS